MPKARKKSAAARPGLTATGRIALGMSLAGTALLWFCCAGQWISPQRFSLLAVSGLAFPFALGVAVATLLLCLLLAPRRAWMPGLGLLVCWSSLRTYYSVSLPSPTPKGCLKVLTWNVCGFSRDGAGGEAIARHIAASGADIAVLQEAYLAAESWNRNVWPHLRRRLPYCDTVYIGENVLMVASAYPVVDKGVIVRGRQNGAAMFRLKLAEGDTLRLVNAHLESMHLSGDELEAYHTMVDDVRRRHDFGINEQSSADIVRKILAAGRIRAEQADSLAAYLERHKGENTIVCGDFNDSPISYAHQRVARHLDDTHTEAGHGIGRSYNRNAIFVRIDQMFHSPAHWRPYGCRVEPQPGLSDHNPMTCSFRRKGGS